MPFEPLRKSTLNMMGNGPDDAIAHEWPADLQAVAQQLTDDAQYLATRYPSAAAAAVVAREIDKRASVTASEAHARLRRSRPFWQQAVAAVIFMGVGGAATAMAIYSRSSDGVPTSHKLRRGTVTDGETSGSEVSGSGILNEEANSVGVQAVGFNTRPVQKANLSEVEMLRIQTAAFEKVIRKLQDELDRRDKQQAEMKQTLELLRQEVSQLHARLSEAPPDDKNK
jgi:hypothetical protein